jgi:beta-glucosidase
VRYPFGHGLSFTTFVTDGLEVAVTGDDTALATVTVSNTGFRAGRHVVQVYVATTAGPVRRPARELRAFKKVMLKPGETRRVELALDRRAFAYYDVETGRWIVAPGEYHIQVGHDAAHIAVEAIVTLPGDVLVHQLSLDSALEEWIRHPVVGPMFIRSLRDSLSNETTEQAEHARDGLRMVASMPLGQFLQFTGIAIAPDSLASMLELGQADIPTDAVKRA